MITKKSEEDVSNKSKNGFTFKRKRQDDGPDLQLTRVKTNDKENINLNEEPKVSIKKISLASGSVNAAPDNEPQKAKKVVVSKSQKTEKEGNQTKENVNDQAPKDKNLIKKDAQGRKEDIDMELEKPKVPSKQSEKLVINENNEPKFVKLPEYPVDFVPISFDLEDYEKENPYKRLCKMVGDICLKENNMLNSEYKDYTFFLGLVNTFSKKLNVEIEKKLDTNLKDRSSSSKVLKENLQNVFEKQKKKVIHKLKEEYSKKGESLTEFQESHIQKGRVSDIVEIYLKCVRDNHKLFLDPNLQKKIEQNREEMEKSVNQKIKSSVHELHTHEKQIKTAHNEIDALAYRLEQQKQKAYTKIFKDYIPTLETDPSDLLKNFLSS